MCGLLSDRSDVITVWGLLSDRSDVITVCGLLRNRSERQATVH